MVKLFMPKAYASNKSGQARGVVVAYGSAIKSSQDGRVGGHLIPYTPPNPRDLHEQYFNAKTERFPEQYPVEGLPVLYNHGYDPRMGAVKMGFLEIAEEQEAGLWVQAQLNRHKEWLQLIENMNNRRNLNLDKSSMNNKATVLVESIDELVKSEVLMWSSGAEPSSVRVAKDGHIAVWYLKEGSLTPEPAATMGTQIAPIKEAGDVLEAVIGDDQKLLTAQQDSSPENDTESNVTPSWAVQISFEESELESDDLDETLEDMDDEQTDEDIDTESVSTVPNDLEDDDEGSDDDEDDEEEEKNLMDELIQMFKELLSALLDSMGGDEEMPSEEQEAALESAIDTVRSEAGVEDLSELEEIPAKAQRAGEVMLSKIIAGYMADVKSASASRKLKIKSRAADLATRYGGLNSQTDDAGGATGSQARAHDVQVTTKYAQFDHEDLSYMVQFMRGIKAHKQIFNWQPSDELVAALADKANAEIEKRGLHESVRTYGETAVKSLTLLKGQGLEGARAFKANELMGTGQAGAGQEWIPTLWLNTLQEKARAENVIFPLMTTINMPSNPYNIPLEGSDPVVYAVQEVTDITQLTDTAGNVTPASKAGTANTTLTAKKLGLRVGFSTETEEDAIIPFLNQMRKQGQRAILDAIDHTLLTADNTNDNTNINHKGAAPAGNEKWLLGWNGMLTSVIRDIGVGDGYSVDFAGAPTVALMRSLQKLLPARYGGRLSDLIWVCDWQTSVALKNMNQVETLEKYGNQATVLTGELGRLDNIPIVMSAELGLADATGDIDDAVSANNTKGRLALIHLPSRWVGLMRNPSANVVYQGERDAYIMYANVRIGYTSYDSQGVAVGYNITV